MSGAGSVPCSESIQRYGRSPYLYPLYGLGELPQGFARWELASQSYWLYAYRAEKIEGEEECVTSNLSVTAESPACTKNRMLLRVY